MKRWLIVLSLVAVLAVGAAVYLAYSGRRQPETAVTLKPVTVPLARHDVVYTVAAPGQVVGTKEFILSLPVGGRLAEVNVRPGSVVEAGEALARLEDAPFVAAVSQAEEDLAATVLIAPFSGVVAELMVMPGETVAAGQSLLLLTDPTLGEVRITVIEEDLPLVQVGQTADLFFDTQPEAIVNGRVARIVPRRVAGEQRPLYHVYLILEGRLPPGVVPGMTADAAIIIDSRQDVLALPRALVSSSGKGTAVVEIWHSGQRQQREITVGLRGDVYVEIITGLQAGDEVVAE